MDDHPALTDAHIDQTLSDLFAEVRADTPADPSLVLAVVARAQAQQRRRGGVLLVGALVGALCCALFLAPVLALLMHTVASVPGPASALSWFTTTPQWLALGLALLWLCLEGVESGA